MQWNSDDLPQGDPPPDQISKKLRILMIVKADEITERSD